MVWGVGCIVFVKVINFIMFFRKKGKKMILPQGYRSIDVNITSVAETTVDIATGTLGHSTRYIYDVTTDVTPEIDSHEIYLNDKWFLFAMIVAGVWFILRLVEFVTGKWKKKFMCYIFFENFLL